MTTTEYVLGGKTVLLKQPCELDADESNEILVRHEELRLVMASWVARPGQPPFAPVLVGPPGVGKTRLAYAAARLAQRELYVFNGLLDVTPSDFAVTLTAGGSSDSAQIRYLLSALATAMIRGGVFLCDELGELPEPALAMLLPLLDDQQCIESTVLGQRIHADPRFRFIATMNSGDPLIGRLKTNDKLARRLDLIEVRDFSEREIQTLIEKTFPSAQSNRRLLTLFWKHWRAAHKDSLPTPSDAIRIFRRAENFAEVERIESSGSWDRLETAGLPIAVEHLEAALSRQSVYEH